MLLYLSPYFFRWQRSITQTRTQTTQIPKRSLLSWLKLMRSQTLFLATWKSLGLVIQGESLHLLFQLKRCWVMRWRGSSTTWASTPAVAAQASSSSSTTGPGRAASTLKSSSGASLESLQTSATSTVFLTTGQRLDTTPLKLNFNCSLKHKGRPVGSCLQFLMELTFVEAVMGADKDLSVDIEDTCLRCNGSGSEPGTRVSVCHYCNGTGMVSSLLFRL